MHRAVVFKARQPHPAALGATEDAFAYDRFLFNPKLLSVGYQYGIDDDQGHQIMLVVKRVFSPVLPVEVFGDASRTRRLLIVRQDSPWQLITNEYTIYDGAGQAVAAIRRDPMIGGMLSSTR